MQVVIIGAGGHGMVALDVLRAEGRYKPAGFLDADAALAGRSVGGLPVFGALNFLPKLRLQRIGLAFVAIGDNRARRRCADLLMAEGFTLVNAIHPTAHVSPTAQLGANVLIAPQAAVCTEARLADAAIINTAAIVDHECEVGAAAHVCPGARLAGRVRVGAEAFIGLGANVIQCLAIGEQAIVGAGAVVLQDVPDRATAVGVPARIVRVGGANADEFDARVSTSSALAD